MSEYILVSIAGIIVVGIAAQWIAWRVGLPSILVLLLSGFVVGPVTGLLNPDKLLGDLLFPVISASVALILFEGGLSLKLSEIRDTGHVVRNLATIGALVSWVLSALGAYYLLRFDLPLALLMGAILVVTGPTVIIPLLRHVHAVGRVSSLIKWEGIVNDPIGAVLAVLVFEVIVTSGVQAAAATVALSLLKTVLVGVGLGGLGAGLLILLLRRYWIPDFLQNSVALMFVLATFTASNVVQEESGLLTVTLMGIILANQKQASIRHIVEFKENLRVLLLASLFIILAARVDLASLTRLGWGSLAYLLLLIVIARPAIVLASTVRSGLTWREKAFLSWMAPRGIVAAAVTSVFALELSHSGYHQAEFMVTEMFVVIVGTVTVYGLTAAPVGRWLGVATPNPQGVLMAGAHSWSRAIAAALQEEGFQVLLVDSNRNNVAAARMEGLPAHCASILSEYILEELEMGGLGRLLALTPNDEVNALAALHFLEEFGRAGVYQLPPRSSGHRRRETLPSPLQGRLLFAPHATYGFITEKFNEGATIKKTRLTEKFDEQAYREMYGDRSLPLFLINRAGELVVFSVDNPPVPRVGHTLISLVWERELGS
ncbi:MAG: hypothetical protein D6784_00950 [Chloroflexi bacterium]|nr:MAG: hypothetical protein D6784_00950 [Chloroflexota bacterium]